MSLKAALALPISRVGLPGLDVFLLAADTGLTAYDASHLWLARSRDAELVTLDTTLARVADGYTDSSGRRAGRARRKD